VDTSRTLQLVSDLPIRETFGSNVCRVGEIGCFEQGWTPKWEVSMYLGVRRTCSDFVRGNIANAFALSVVRRSYVSH